jgi:hypothetical protein
MNAELFFIAMIVLVAVMAAVAFWFIRKARLRDMATWESLVAKLEPVDRRAVAAIALDLFDESGARRSGNDTDLLDPSEVWDMVGGLTGLEAMERNCAVLIDIAAYVQRWYPEAVVVAEQLRLNAREVQFHLGRLKGAARTGNLHSAFADYAQRAVATYYRMTRSVLALCEHAHAPGLAALEQAI